MKFKNLDNSDTEFPQDSDIEFIEEGHVYRYKDTENFISVSGLYSQFFKPFEAEVAAKSKVAKMKCSDPEEAKRLMATFIDEWKATGQFASEVGTFMHKQIENSFNGIAPENQVHIKYDGEYKKIDEVVNIEKELTYFNQFRKEKLHSTPFRTEWCVFDAPHKVAGTIDLICKTDDGKYEIFDWKRSKKIDPRGKFYTTGINGLEHIPDTSYWHYVLQQNTYRYILENNYGIEVSAMHLVVLHPENDSYEIVDIPERNLEIETMFLSRG